MTRDEAVELFGKMEDRGTSCLGDDLTDWAVAVGILKVDETPRVPDRAAEVLGHRFYRDMVDEILGVLTNSGLKIVEK